MSGRARDGRLVHFATGGAEVRPGDLVETEVTYAAPHHLNADGPLLNHRRTLAGDAWALAQAVPGPRPAGTVLGLPKLPVRTS